MLYSYMPDSFVEMGQREITRKNGRTGTRTIVLCRLRKSYFFWAIIGWKSSCLSGDFPQIIDSENI